MTQMTDLKIMGLRPLNHNQMQEVDGGKTDFAYDVGTFIRALWKFNPTSPKAIGESAAVVGAWYVQQ